MTGQHTGGAVASGTANAAVIPLAPPGPLPSIGRIVYYKMTAENAQAVTYRRASESNWQAANMGGVVTGVGNPVVAGMVFPAMIVRVWGETPESAVQLQVFLDGTDVYWASSASCGDGEGQYSWPVVSR